MGLGGVDDTCGRCYGGELEEHGPVCTPGNQRQSWRTCRACGYISHQRTHPCNDMHCDVHGGSAW